VAFVAKVAESAELACVAFVDVVAKSAMLACVALFALVAVVAEPAEEAYVAVAALSAYDPKMLPPVIDTLLEFCVDIVPNIFVAPVIKDFTKDVVAIKLLASVNAGVGA
jgi:hypothetical protein